MMKDEDRFPYDGKRKRGLFDAIQSAREEELGYDPAYFDMRISGYRLDNNFDVWDQIIFPAQFENEDGK